MPSRKVTELETLVSPAGVDRLYIVDDPNGTPTSKQTSLDTFFGNVPSNTSINATLHVANTATFSGPATFNANVSVGTFVVDKFTVNSNGIVINTQLTPANSSVSAIDTGKIFFDTNYLYIKVSNTVIKRVALSSF